MHIGIDLDDTIIERDLELDTWRFKDDAIEYLHRLYMRGYILHIITARSVTVSNIDEIGYIVLELKYNGISISDVTYTYGEPKGRFAKEIGCICMIDDQMGYLTDCISYGVIPILYESSWRDTYHAIVISVTDRL